MSFCSMIDYNNYLQIYKQWFIKNAKILERLNYWKIEGSA